jgi:hypothetical protein
VTTKYLSPTVIDIINTEARLKKSAFAVPAVSNAITDLLVGTQAKRTIFRLWGARTPVAMGDGVRFRLRKGGNVDYVYVRYWEGFVSFELEFGRLEGMDYGGFG